MDCRGFVTLILGLTLFLSVADATSSWKPCSLTEDYRVTIRDVKVSPDPVVRGGDANFEIPAVASETINGGTVTVQVYYLGVPVHTEKDDLCIRTSCPIAPGDFDISNSEGLPDFTPTGAYRLDMRIQDENGGLLTCLKINFRIAAPEVLLKGRHSLIPKTSCTSNMELAYIGWLKLSFTLTVTRVAWLPG